MGTLRIVLENVLVDLKTTNYTDYPNEKEINSCHW